MDHELDTLQLLNTARRSMGELERNIYLIHAEAVELRRTLEQMADPEHDIKGGSSGP